jgi:hypothetical protein
LEIKRAGTQPSAKGPSDWFTGTVRIDPLFQASDPSLVQGASVIFEPGSLAYTPVRPNADCHRRLRLGSARGRPDRGDPAR